MKKYKNISFKENRLLFRNAPADGGTDGLGNVDRFEKSELESDGYIDIIDETVEDTKENVKKDVNKVLDKKQNERETAGLTKYYDEDGFTSPKEGWWSNTMKNTEFLTLYDLYVLAKGFGEVVIKNFKEADEYRRARVAAKMYGDQRAEGIRRVDESENKIIEGHTNEMKEKNVNQIKEIIYNTTEKFRMYAGLDLLAEKGQLPLDSPELVKALNRLGGHTMEIADSTEKVVPSKVVELLNKIYSEGTGTKMQNKNTSNYKTDEFESANENLRNIKDGHAKKLQYMMNKFERGHYVDPREYEAVLRLMMGSVKGTLEEQIFFFIKGLVQKNRFGETLLPYERAFKISSGLPEMPLMKYFKQKSSKLNYDTYKVLFEEMSYEDGSMNFEAVKKYIYVELDQFGGIQGFVSAILNTGATKIDMDILHYYSPILAQKEIKGYLKQKSKGQWAYNQPEDYAFGLFGYGTYINQLTDAYWVMEKERDREGLVDNICNAFAGGAMLEGGLAGNYLSKDRDVKRFTNREELYASENHNIKNPDPNDKNPPTVKVFMDSMYDALEGIAGMYGNAELTGIIYRIKNAPMPNLSDTDYENLYGVLNRVVKADNGDKMIAYLSAHDIQEF